MHSSRNAAATVADFARVAAFVRPGSLSGVSPNSGFRPGGPGVPSTNGDVNYGATCR
jgi:hypothetical protein